MALWKHYTEHKDTEVCENKTILEIGRKVDKLTFRFDNLQKSQERTLESLFVKGAALMHAVCFMCYTCVEGYMAPTERISLR